MTSTATAFGADYALPLWDMLPLEDAFTVKEQPNGSPPIDDQAVVTRVTRPWLFGYKPTTTTTANNRAVLVLGGGGYVQLMVGREGVQVARWLASLGFEAYVLVHRFPTASTSPSAPVDDARQALRLIIKQQQQQKQQKHSGRSSTTTTTTPENSLVGLCGLSSGGHLAAALLAEYPALWSTTTTAAGSSGGGLDAVVPPFEFAIIGYAPISTNAKGHQIVPDKAPLDPPEKQELYDVVVPDRQFRRPAPPSFIVYSANDPVVPVVNAYRLAQGIQEAGGAPVELHVFADAPHGFALDTKELPVSEWPRLCESWLRQRGILS